jgi:hypothetical protein
MNPSIRFFPQAVFRYDEISKHRFESLEYASKKHLRFVSVQFNNFDIIIKQVFQSVDFIINLGFGISNEVIHPWVRHRA